MSIPGYDLFKLSNQTPEQKKLFGNISQQLGMGTQPIDFLQKILSGDQDFFNQLEQPAYQNLEKGLAQTANRFSQFGAQGSSAFQNAQAGQSADLASQLAQQRHNLMMGASDRLMNQASNLLNMKPFENVLQKQDQIDWGSLIGKLGPELIKLLPMLFGMPPAGVPGV